MFKYFFLNGNKYVTDADLTLFDLIIYFNYNQTLLVLEYNMQICQKKNWEKIFISNNDTIEIITIVGGG